MNLTYSDFLLEFREMDLDVQDAAYKLISQGKMSQEVFEFLKIYATAISKNVQYLEEELKIEKEEKERLESRLEKIKDYCYDLNNLL